MRHFPPLSILAALLAGCTTFAIGGGAVRTDGTVAVSEHKSGTDGAALEMGVNRALGDGTAEVGAFMTADQAGYADNGDGDGIRWFGLSVRYRGYFGVTGALAPYFALGGGPGVGGGYGRENLVLEAFGELGVRIALGSHAAFTLSVRERPAIFISGERWTSDPLNTLQAAFGIEIRPSGEPAKRAPTETRVARRR